MCIFIINNGPLGLVKKVKYNTLTEYKVVNIAAIVAIKYTTVEVKIKLTICWF